MIDLTKWNLHEPDRPQALLPTELQGYSSPVFSQTPSFVEFRLTQSGKAILEEAEPNEGATSLHATMSVHDIPEHGDLYLAGIDGICTVLLHNWDIRLEYTQEADAKEHYTTLLKDIAAGVEMTFGLAIFEGELSVYAKRHDTGECTDFSKEVDVESFGDTTMWVGAWSENLEGEALVRVHSLTPRRGEPRPEPVVPPSTGNAPLSE